MNTEDVSKAVLAAVDAAFEEGAAEPPQERSAGDVVEIEGLSVSITFTAQRLTFRRGTV